MFLLFNWGYFQVLVVGGVLYVIISRMTMTDYDYFDDNYAIIMSLVIGFVIFMFICSFFFLKSNAFWLSFWHAIFGQDKSGTNHWS